MLLSRLQAFLRSSIGKKSLMAVTGLLLIGFLIVHVAGNLTLYADTQGHAMGAYAGTLAALGPLVLILEAALGLLFLVHVLLAMRTWLDNREARPVRYKELAAKGQRTTASMSMIVTGLVVLVFLVIHLIDFRLVNGVTGHPDPAQLGRMVVDKLSSPLGAGLYFVAMVVLGVHLWHAFQSLMQTLGLRHPTYLPAIRCVGMTLSILIGGLFATFPVLCLVYKGLWPWS